MGALESGKLGALRLLVEGSPDKVLHGLEAALCAQGSQSSGMNGVRDLVMAERRDRDHRDRVFSPILALCAPNPGPVERLTFPANPLPGLWRGLKSTAPHEVRAACRAELEEEDEAADSLHDQLCLAAARDLRAGADPAFVAVAARLDAAMPGGAEELAACLALAPVARRALRHLSEWMGRITDERAAAARLAFKDAGAVADDAGPRLFEILFAHLPEPWLGLRLISAVMDRPTDGFVAVSELAGFGERILGDIDRRLAEVIAFDPARGPAAGVAAGRAVHVAVIEINEFEQSIQMSRDTLWGKRLAAQKRGCAGAAELRLRQVEAAVAAALPVEAGRRGVRGRPRLSGPPSPEKVAKAAAFTAFVREVRSASATGGFGSIRSGVVENLEGRLGQYLEDLLEIIHANADPDVETARLYLDLAAGFLGDVTEIQLAQIARRRAAAA